jgi:hypothetical protein
VEIFSTGHINNLISAELSCLSSGGLKRFFFSGDGKEQQFVNYAGCHAANWQGWRRSKALLHNTLVSGVRRLQMCAACDSFTSTSLEVPSNLL